MVWSDLRLQLFFIKDGLYIQVVPDATDSSAETD
jgi:hypothetical protein